MNKELLEKIRKNSKVEANYLNDKLAEKRTLTKTKVPSFNIMCSGKYSGGFYGGLTIAAAPSKHFKTMLVILALKSYLDADEDAIAVFYDSERGASKSTFESYDVDMSRVIIKDIMNIEEFKFDVMDLLNNQITKGDKIFIGIDSIGNLASIKEIDDALTGSSAADMTRAKQLKSVFRMITPYLGKYDIPMFAVNHVYSEIGLYPKTIMGGGQGPLLAADTVLFVTKRVNKDGKEVEGFDFTLVAHKSRFIREDTKIPISVDFEKGIILHSGLLEIGLATDTVVKRGHRYARQYFDAETGEVTEDEKALFKKDIDISWFDEKIDDPKWPFRERLEKHYELSHSKMIKDAEFEDDENDELVED